MEQNQQHGMIYRLKCLFISINLGVLILTCSFLTYSNKIDISLIYFVRNHHPSPSNTTSLFKVKGYLEGEGDLMAIDKTIRRKAGVNSIYIGQNNTEHIKQTLAEPNITLQRYFLCNGPTGRLGNQLFDFASSLGIANTLNYMFVILSTHPLLKFFDINQTVVEQKPVNLMRISLREWRKNTWGRNRAYLAHNLTLGGYYRVWGYFKHITDNVKKSLTIKDYFLDKAKAFLQLNTPRNRTLIGIHVRMGDFLNEKQQAFGKAIASKEYITSAMAYFQKRFRDSFFVVVSVDKQWCETNLAGRNVVVGPCKEAIVDFAILTLCQHIIVTSGTFGWWAGWLAGGEVVYWTGFPKPGSQNEIKILFKGEYYPPHWTGIDSD